MQLPQQPIRLQRVQITSLAQVKVLQLATGQFGAQLGKAGLPRLVAGQERVANTSSIMRFQTGKHWIRRCKTCSHSKLLQL